MLVLVIGGMILYVIYSPLTINLVHIPKVDGYEKANEEVLNGFYVTGATSSPIVSCRYITYSPDSSLNHIYICKPAKSTTVSLDYWVNRRSEEWKSRSQKFTTEETEIGNSRVKTITLSNENCGNPGFCTTYYWEQGRVVFSSATKPLVEAFIFSN